MEKQWPLVRTSGAALPKVVLGSHPTTRPSARFPCGAGHEPGRSHVPSRGRETRPRDQDRDNDRERKDTRGPRRGSSDEDALRLREEGRSYAAVARSLNLKRSNDALAAFLRAMRQRPDAERAELIVRERARLDLLETRIRDRDKDDPTRLDRRLGALEKLRSSLS